MMSPQGAPVQIDPEASRRVENELLLSSLEHLSGRESRLVDCFYDTFFDRHPKLRDLFGEHGINEREEMIRETLACVVAHVDDESWLDENLMAMGRSHVEYGVENPMYDAFIDCMLDSIEQVVDEGWSPASREAWCGALVRITTAMRVSEG